LLEEWTATRASRDNCLPQDHRKLINNLKLIQDYLCSFESQVTFPSLLKIMNSVPPKKSTYYCMQLPTLVLVQSF
jgi:hypothetical protein